MSTLVFLLLLSTPLFALGSQYCQSIESSCKKCDFDGGNGEGGNGGQSDCQDKYHDKNACKNWAEQKQCNTNPNWMKANCASSCKSCDVGGGDGGGGNGGQSDCQDKSACKNWAEQKQCNTNPNWMKANCASSCKSCDVGGGDGGGGDEGGGDGGVGEDGQSGLKCPASVGHDNDMPEDVRQKYLSEHNKFRKVQGLDDLTWNDELANQCQLMVDTSSGCNMMHKDMECGAERIGQNLAWDMRSPEPIDKAVERWHSEIKYYNYGSNSCSGVCGHYTQLMWRDTKEVGCATKICGTERLMCCDYYPPGNWMGKKPW